MKNIIQLLLFIILILTSIKLIGQEEAEGYSNGLQIIGKNLESSLIKETEWDDTKWDEIEWTDCDTSIYKYDNQQRLVKIENFSFEDSIWVPSYNVLFNYSLDNKGYIKTTQYALGENEYREGKQRIEQIVNEENLVVEKIESDWKNLQWIKQTKTTYRYDDLGNIINNDFYRFEDNEWKLIRERAFVYDILGDKISNFTRYFNLDGTLDNQHGYGIEKDTVDNQIITDFWSMGFGALSYYRKEINYLSDDNLIDSLHVHLVQWDSSTKLHRKEEYDYNLVGQLTQKTFFDRRNGSWKLNYRINNEYDDSKNLIFQGGYYWSNKANDWVYSILAQKEWIYSENGTLIKEVKYGVSDMIYNGFHDVFRILTYYVTPTSIDNNSFQKKDGFQLFPNPTSHFLNIKEIDKSTYPLKMKIFNLQGQILRQESLNTPSTTIKLNNLPNGSYFIQLQDKFGIIKTEKFIKQQT